MTVKLLLIRGQPQGKALVFPAGEFVFGRGEECHIRPNSSWVSRQHCLLRISDTCAQLRDLGSTNGTLVNGIRVVGERALENGDQIQVGPLVFEVLLESAVAKRETGTFYIDTAEVPIVGEDLSTSMPNTLTGEAIVLPVQPRRREPSAESST